MLLYERVRHKGLMAERIFAEYHLDIKPPDRYPVLTLLFILSKPLLIVFLP